MIDEIQIPEFKHCVKALSGAMLLTKQAIQIEIAVAFIVFNEFGETSLLAKKALRNVYATAGDLDCLTAESPSYQTVTRRLNRCAAFYDATGSKKVKRILKDKFDAEAIEVVKQYLEPYDIKSMDDLKRLTGEPRQPAEPKPEEPHDRRASDAPGVVHVKTKHIDLTVPPEAPKSELIALAKKLMAMAEKMD